MRRAAVGSAIALVLSFFFACVGSDPDPETPAGSSGSSGSSGSTSSSSSSGSSLAPDAAPPQFCPSGCAPPPPPGWQGPSVIYDGKPDSAPATCPSEYGKRETDTFHWENLGAPVCSCTTSTLSEMMCSLTMMTYGGSATCSTAVTASYELMVTSTGSAPCYSPGTKQPITLSAPTFSAKCSLSTVSPIPEPKKSAAQVVCSPTAPTTCTNRPDCVAAPPPVAPFTKLCIHHDGDVPSCPSADYSIRFVAAKTNHDDRACSTCTAKPTGTCKTSFPLYDSVGCNDAHVDKTLPLPCTESSGADLSGILPTDAKCTVTGGTPSGALSETDPVTYCCQ